MATDVQPQRTGIAGGVMLLGLGVLLITGWWWPGIMLVIGVAIAAERLMAGQTTAAIGVLILFLGIPVAIAVFSDISVPWVWVGGLVLAGLGIAAIVRAMSRGGASTSA